MGFNSGFKGLKSHRITGTLRVDQYTFLIILRSFLLRMRNVSNKRCRENYNTFCVQQPPPLLIRAVCDNVGKCYRAGQDTDNNMVHVRCKLDT